ncbi:uncharacterized protein LOC143856428 [Tasmannia lanceolata]|uniref:uncharacterized protein LOC143856428 n=1 Tax=Tasmannia lanceolata TaxID=3420 RepID=UPI0040634CAE
MREIKSHLFRRDSKKRKGLHLWNDVPTKRMPKREGEELLKTGYGENKDGEAEIVSDKGGIGDGVLLDDMKKIDIVDEEYDVGKVVVDDSIEHIYIDSQITQDVRDAAANMVAILLDSPEMKPSQSKKQNKKQYKKLIGSNEKNVKQCLRRRQPSRALSSRYFIGKQKTNDALGNVTELATIKVDALAALQPYDKVIESDGYYMCKEDLLILTDPRGWLSSSDECSRKE